MYRHEPPPGQRAPPLGGVFAELVNRLRLLLLLLLALLLVLL